MSGPHWPWLHGPTERPDPRVGERSLSAVRGDEPARMSWDEWLNQPTTQPQVQ